MKGNWLVYAGGILFSLVGIMHGEIVLAADDDKAVRQAAEQFYAALNAMFTGDLEPMKEVWSHEDDVTTWFPAAGFRPAGRKSLRNGKCKLL